MKTWVIALAVGLLLIAGVTAVNALQEESSTNEVEAVSYSSCGGGCSAGNTCGNPTCGAKTGGTCGCQG